MLAGDLIPLVAMIPGVNISINGERFFICRYGNGEHESNDQPLNIVIPPF